MLKHESLMHGRWITIFEDGPNSYSVRVLEAFCGVHSHASDQHTDLRRTTTACDGRHFLTFQNYISQYAPFAYTAHLRMGSVH